MSQSRANKSMASHDEHVAAYFTRQWREGRPYRVAKLDNCLLLSDGLCILRVRPDHPAVDSRKVVPTLPAEGSGYVYLRGKDPVLNDWGVIHFWQTFTTAETVELQPSSWLYEVSEDTTCRAFLSEAGKVTLVGKMLTDLLDRTASGLGRYRWRRADGLSSPVLAFSDSGGEQTLAAVFAPFLTRCPKPIPTLDVGEAEKEDIR